MRHLFYISLVFLFASCAFPRYKYTTEAKQKLNFNKGKWIINNVEGPEGTITDLTKIVLKKIKGDSVMYIDELRLRYPIAYNISFNPDTLALKNLNTITQFDYLVCVKTGIIDNDTQLQYLPTPTGYLKRRAEASVVVYDLKYLQKIYSDHVLGSIILGVDDVQIRYVKPTKRLMYSSLRKALKKMKKS